MSLMCVSDRITVTRSCCIHTFYINLSVYRSQLRHCILMAALLNVKQDHQCLSNDCRFSHSWKRGTNNMTKVYWYHWKLTSSPLLSRLLSKMSTKAQYLNGCLVECHSCLSVIDRFTVTRSWLHTYIIHQFISR